MSPLDRLTPLMPKKHEPKDAPPASNTYLRVYWFVGVARGPGEVADLEQVGAGCPAWRAPRSRPRPARRRDRPVRRASVAARPPGPRPGVATDGHGRPPAEVDAVLVAGDLGDHPRRQPGRGDFQDGGDGGQGGFVAGEEQPVGLGVDVVTAQCGGDGQLAPGSGLPAQVEAGPAPWTSMSSVSSPGAGSQARGV